MTNPQDTTERFRDAAYSIDIPTSWGGGVSGYLHGPRAFRPWEADEWRRFPNNRKLPIWVGAFGGMTEGRDCVDEMLSLAVPLGTRVAVDMEQRVDKTYLRAFGHVLKSAGYKVWVYGSAFSLFMNPALNGYWVADYQGIGPFMYNHADVRMTQYQSGPDYDSSTCKDYEYDESPWWV